MINIYDTEIDEYTLKENFTRIGNQIFKLLPLREEGKDWEKPLETLLVEIAGLYSLLDDRKDILALFSKLEGLKVKADQIDFMLYRRVIFECCGLIDKIKKQLS